LRTERQLGKVREPVTALYPRLTESILRFIETHQDLQPAAPADTVAPGT
jgi:hypothetical protein